MKILSRFLGPAILSFTAFISAGALGSEICVHGTSGSLQTPGKSSEKYMGWGLDFNASPTADIYNDVWIHYSIPVDSARYIVGIRLYVYVDSSEISIKRLHIWDGEQQVKQINSGVYIPYKPGWNNIPISFPGRYFTRGLGVSILPVGGFEASTRTIISGLCAM